MAKLIKPGKEPEKLSLPLSLSVPKTSLSDYSILLYGQEKIGKTDLAAQFEENFFMMFEPGARALSVYQAEIQNWTEAEQYVALLKKEKDRFRTLTWDTCDIAYNMCLKQTCIDEGFDHPSDEGYGKGWSKVNSRFAELVNMSLKLNRGVIFTSHAAEKEITTRLGDKYSRIVPTMSGGARNVIEALVDIWIYLYYDKAGERWMRIRGNDQVAAGHRLQNHFKGIERIPMGRNAKEAYTNLVAAFENNLGGEPANPVRKLRIGGVK